jgi:hypothetical protein
MPANHLEASVRLKPGGAVLDLHGEISGFAQEAPYSRTSWKDNSRKLPLCAFSAPLCQAALREGACKSARRLL